MRRICASCHNPRKPVRVSLRTLLGGVSVLVALAACSARQPVADPASASGPASSSVVPPNVPDAVAVYRKMGLMVADGDLPFVARVGFLAGSAPESTTVIVAVSLPASAVTFNRHDSRRLEGEYHVDGEFTRNGAPVYQVSTKESVVVASYRETNRSDARLVFQESFVAAAGRISLSLSLRDAGSTRRGQLRTELMVPQLSSGGVSSALPVLQGEGRSDRSALPGIVLDPLAAYTFGRDTAVKLYLEHYAPGDSMLLEVFLEDGRLLRSDTVGMRPLGSGTGFTAGEVRIPLSRLGIGVSTVRLSAVDGSASASPRLPVFVSFGPEVPLTTFEDLVNYLHWFTSASRIAELRAATPEQRPAAWRRFLADTDPDPSTTEHEALGEYFQRVAVANVRFRGEAAQGWLSDRGRVFVALGEPDAVVDNTVNAPAQRGRMVTWEYQRLNTRLVFQDVTGFGGWRLLPGQEDSFRAALLQLHGT